MQVCFHCGSANSTGAKECHSCSARLIEDDDPDTGSSENGTVQDVSECPMCATVLEPGAEVCPNCKTDLTAAPEMPRSHEQDITSRYDEFADKVKVVRDGSLSKDNFGSWLKEIRKSLNLKRQNYVELIKDSDFEDIDVERLEVLQTNYFQEREEEVTMTMQGILEFEDAMELMWGFVENESSDISTLDQALKKMWEGNEMCNEAIRMNREFRSRLEEDWGYM